MEAWAGLGTVLEDNGVLSSDLKEHVRRTLAQGNGCEYCKAKGKPDSMILDEKISLAVGFAEVFSKQKGEISTSILLVLKQSFSDIEVSELLAFICFTNAQQNFGALMKLKPNEEG